MAVDTRNKRASCLGLALSLTLTLPAPDGTVGADDRQQVAFSYAGIEAAESVEQVVTYEAVAGYAGSVTVPGGFVGSVAGIGGKG